MCPTPPYHNNLPHAAARLLAEPAAYRACLRFRRFRCCDINLCLRAARAWLLPLFPRADPPIQQFMLIKIQTASLRTALLSDAITGTLAAAVQTFPTSDTPYSFYHCLRFLYIWRSGAPACGSISAYAQKKALHGGQRGLNHTRAGRKRTNYHAATSLVYRRA